MLFVFSQLLLKVSLAIVLRDAYRNFFSGGGGGGGGREGTIGALLSCALT